ncbi:hypothetical protein HPP92_012124 [Vanilla planifolia]|uniref:DUF4005 domain-containing protein n=1 Tax=Vanilla planifolia TaxID=51239 RepID=A0A835QWZ2_VANPL|nr:hypothetical protein HPP92_012124 [Vanilla planifolia]
MVKAGKWLKSFLSGKKEKTQEKEKESNTWLKLPPPPPPPTSPKEKLRRSFHYERDRLAPPPVNRYFDREVMHRRHSMAVASATEAAVYVGRLAARKATKNRCNTAEEIAAIKIQASFRSFLARKALRALKGLVKLQALGRGFLVRKRTAQALRSVQALLTVQARARAHRARMAEEVHAMPPRESFQKMTRELQLEQYLYGEARERWILGIQKSTSAPPSLTELSSGSRSARFESSSFTKAKNGPPGIEVGFHLSRNYMAKTESWRAKVRSHSAPRQRPDSCDQKQPSRQRSSF